jgi:hypothetical protein
VTPLRIAGLYFSALAVFAVIYYFMPTSYFFHTTIQNEPATEQHRDQFEAAINHDLAIDAFDVTPLHLTVSSNQAHNFEYHRTFITFVTPYYYYKFTETDEERHELEKQCGESERPGFFRRTIDLNLTMSASISRTRTTVRAKPQAPLGACDVQILNLLYKSFEKTDYGFQAMVDTSPNTQDLLIAVSEEQLGNAPSLFRFDRGTRMLYFSVAAITTTGFGDIVPMTPCARLFAALECLIGIVLAGAFVNAVTKS